MFTGNFKGFFIFTLITLIHEAGHVSAALYYKWRIEKVMLLPFGALTVFNEKINRPLKEEFIILIMGPLVQIIAVSTYLTFNFNEIVFNYSNLILLFNLLPIYPLDGSKLLNIILNKITSFKKSHLLTIYISALTIFCLFLKVKFNLIFILIILFVGIKVFEEFKNHRNLFNLFLLERHINDFHFNKNKVIKGIHPSKMKRDYKHTFYNNGKYVTEKQFLRKRFDFTGKM